VLTQWRLDRRGSLRLTDWILLSCLAATPIRLGAEDSDGMRPYLHIRRGEFNHNWGVQDMWGLGVGLNLNRYLGVEVAVDNWDKALVLSDLGDSALGELSTWSFVPQLRVRYPLFHDTLVPYLVGGFGGAFHQFNDRKSFGYGRAVEADGAGWSATAGGGIDWFFTDNLALNLEAKQIWLSSQDVSVDRVGYRFDPTDWVATIGFRVFLEENRPRPLVSASDHAPTRIYLGFRAGRSLSTDDDWASNVTLSPESGAWGDLNQHYGGCVGVDLGRHWGFELAADGGEVSVDVAGVGSVCEYVVSPIIPQVRLRLPMSKGRWVPYGMAGMGICYTEANDYKAASEQVDFDASGIYPAVTVGGGIEYFLARNLSLSAETRWLYSWNHEFTLDGTDFRGDVSHLQFLLALRLYMIEF